ncbi:MAG TPA: class I adenylate-forming enzyme family protein [Vicinamibacterales bacterium]|nr:class I adenylate-forming enzyme family protein [Vicinamibacterales bacterium]
MPSAIVEAFRRIERDHPDRPLIYLPAAARVTTAAELAGLSATIRAGLEAAGIAPGSLIGAALGNRPAAIAAFLACAERGHPFLPIDGGTATEEISHIGRQLNAAALMLSTPASVSGFQTRQVVAGHVMLAVADEPPSGPAHNAAVLKLTSGTTGLPRATLTSEAALVLDTRTLMDAMGIGADDIQIAAIPLSHAYGFGNLLVPLLLQGTGIVMREAFVPQRLPEDARAVGARVFPGVPFMFDFFAKHLPPDGWPATLTTLLSAGARLPRPTVDRFREAFGLKIHSFYGTTETGGICFDGGDDVVAEGTVGRPLESVSISLLPHDDAPFGGGRVLVRGRGVVTSYADGTDPDVFVDGGFLTGDLGAFDSEGRLVLSGRVSPFVNVAGRKVQPGEVEQVLRNIEGVADVRVMGVADGRRGEHLVAFLVMRTARPTVVDLRRFCATRLASYKIPRQFIFLDEIPLTARGKIDRAALDAAARAASTGML